MGSSRQVIVGTYFDANAAHLVRARLESSDVHAWLVDEHTASVNPLYSPLIGGIKLAVHPRDEAAAREVIGVEPGQTRDPEVCPACGASEVESNPMGFGWLLLLTVATFGIYLPLWYKRSRCGACGSRW